ncbi:MAG: hypothetical protein FWF73_02590 [Spirochaetes bacterium]|nr:hypothetical protein [Spirochaetota bacterium]
MFKWKLNKYAIIFFMVSASVIGANSKDFSYREINLDSISRYYEDRIAYQQIEYIVDPEVHQQQDPSVASLLIIKSNKMYLFKDGYDDPKAAEENYRAKDMSRRLSFNETWERNIDGKPDFLLIYDKRKEILRNIILPGSNENLNQRYTDFYLNIRNAFLQKHVDSFRQMMVYRTDVEFKVNRAAIPKRINDDTPVKYHTSVTAKTIDGRIYYAEDADGDGITETFSVEIGDGFNWDYKSGPNIILILKNKQEDIKNIIGKLTKEAYEGTPEEVKLIDQQFDRLEKEIPVLMDQIIRGDFDKYGK